MARLSALTASGMVMARPRASSRFSADDGVVLEQRELPREPHDRLARLGRARGLRPHDQHATDLLLERLDALAHRRRRDVQPPRGGLERALVDDGGDGGGEFRDRFACKPR